MTAHNITITNGIGLFGPANPNFWNVYNWGEFLWGEGNEDLQVLVVKPLDNTWSLTSDVTIYVDHNLAIENDLAFDGDMYAESLTDGSGYNYVFPSNTTDAETRTIPTYTSVNDGTGTWAAASAATTVWS